MALKNKVQRILPPLLFDVLDKRLQKKEIYKNYSEAIKHCTTPDGYETDDIVRVVLAKTLRHKRDIESNALVHLGNLEAFGVSCFVHLMDRKQINVIDFGGGCGSHFFIYRAFLPKNVSLNWFVVETPAMVRYAKQFENEHLKFYDDLDLALEVAKKTGEIDFFHTSGTLQCVDEPFAFLEKMLSVKADFMLFNRNGFTLGERDLTVIHRAKLSWNGIAGQLPEGINDRWTEYPFTFVQKSKFEARVQKDYDFISTFEEKSGIFPVNDEPLVGLSVFCKRKIN